MSAWTDYLDGFTNEQRRQEAIDWHASRPPSIRKLMKRYPPGTVINVKGKPAFVVSYNETHNSDQPGLCVSYTDPRIDYDRAMEDRFFICGSHFKGTRAESAFPISGATVSIADILAVRKLAQSYSQPIEEEPS